MTTTQTLHILLVTPPGTSVAERILTAFTAGELPTRLTTAGSLGEARQAMATSRPDLVLTTPHLSDGSAIDFLAQSPVMDQGPVVLLVEASMPQGELSAMLAAGIFDYLFLEPSVIADLPYRARRLVAEWIATVDLHGKEAFNFALFQHSPVAMVVVDQDGAVLKSNLARRAMGLPLPQLGAPLFDAEHGDAEATLAGGIQESIRTGEVRQWHDLELPPRTFNVTLAPFPGGAVAILDDITERKRAQAEAEQRQRQMIQADKMIALGNLVSGVAHEISNPNNVMILGAGVLQRSMTDIIKVLDHYEQVEGEFAVDRRPYSEVRQDLPEMAETVLKAAERIRALVDDLKAFARKGSETLNETVDVNAVVEAAAKLLHPLIRKVCHRFRVETSAGLPTLSGNSRNLEQVVVNLISNACQALPSPDRSVVASTRSEDGGRVVVIEVRDEGRGMPAEVLARITEPFFTTRQDDGGTGLGLSISRTIVENHRGELRFTSRPGEGTVAAVRLPVHRSGAGAQLHEELPNT